MYSSKLSNYQLIFTFLKENIKSRNTKDKAKTQRTVKNNSNRSDLHVQRNCFSNQQKKKKQLCTCSTLFGTFPYRCFAGLKILLPSYLHVLWRKCLCSYFLGSRASISHFQTDAIELQCFSSNEIGLHCYLILALALSLLSKSMQPLIFRGKKDFFFLSL